MQSQKEKFPSKTTSDKVEEELEYCKDVIYAVEKEPRIAGVLAVREWLNVLK